jgi:WD40 repeat protein
MQQSRVIKTITQKNIGSPKLFLPDNKTLILSGQKIHFMDVESKKVMVTIKPKYMPDSQKYNMTRISALTVSPDGNMLYVGGNKGQIERWKIEKALLGSGMSVSYVDKIEDTSIREVGALKFERNDKNTLIIVSKNLKVKFYNTKAKSVKQTYIADEYMGAKSIVISDDHKYMLVMGDHGAFLWKLGEKEQYDIVKGSKIVGGIFLEDSSRFILMAREVKIWKIEDK